jgi:uncharacterized membrane protein YbhN (UPF0104 family)
MSEQRRWKSVAKFAVKLLIAAAILYFVFQKLDTQSLKRYLFTISPLYIALAFSFFVLSKVLSAFRLKRFLDVLAVPVSSASNLKLYWLGMFYNLFLPGGIGGDGYKILLFRQKYQVPAKKLVVPLLLDRVSGVFSLVILLCALVLFISVPFISTPLWPIALLGIVVLVVSSYFIIQKLFPAYTLRFFYLTPYSLAVQGCQVVSATVLLIGFGVQCRLAENLFSFLVSSIVSIVPITPGGVGLRELTFTYSAKWGLIVCGQAAPEMIEQTITYGAALGLMFFAITALASLFGLYYHLFPEKMGILHQKKA